MEEQLKIENLISHVKEYGEERMNLVMLDAKEKSARFIGSTASVLLLVISGTFTLVFISLAIAWFLGQQLQHTWLGFLIVGVVYLFAAVLLWMNREKWIGFPVMNAFLKHIADDED